MHKIRFALLAVLVGCSAKEKAPEATPEAAPAAAPAPTPTLALADVAGKWTYVARTPTGDTVLVTGELNATADNTGWTMTLPGRKSLPMTVSVNGDSVMTTVAPYESVLRKGVKVTTEGVLRKSGDKMIGTLTAHYSVKTADSVRMMIIEATRKP
jgi:glucose/arabinose dehydrogenase